MSKPIQDRAWQKFQESLREAGEHMERGRKGPNHTWSYEAREEKSPFHSELSTVLNEVQHMLLEKNSAYGDSALNPVRIFSRSDTIEQLKVRIDDKLSRLMRGDAAGEDTEMDLLGYLVMLRVARNRAAK